MRLLSVTLLGALIFTACSGQPALDRVETWQGTVTPLPAAAPQVWRLDLRDSAEGYFGQAYRLDGQEATLIGPALAYPYDEQVFIAINLSWGQHRLRLTRAGNVLAGTWEQRGGDGAVTVNGHAEFGLLNTKYEPRR